MPIQMFNWTSRPQAEFLELAAAAGLVLLAITLLMNGTAIYGCATGCANRSSGKLAHLSVATKGSRAPLAARSMRVASASSADFCRGCDVSSNAPNITRTREDAFRDILGA
jgi:hypothetical protein